MRSLKKSIIDAPALISSNYKTSSMLYIAVDVSIKGARAILE